MSVTRYAVTAAILAMAQAVFAQTCTVQEDRKRVTLAGRFSIGSATVEVTLPGALFQRELPTLFLEVSNPESLPEAFIDAGGEKVRIEDGAELHVTHKAGERTVFSVSGKDGQRWCAWQPSIRTWEVDPPKLPDGFRTYAARIGGRDGHFLFVNARDPVYLNVGGKLAAGTGRYRLDEVPAMLLARTSWEVILRDPRPRAGLRTVASQGYATTVPFLDVELQMSRPARGNGTLAIRVVTNELVQPSVRMLLFNFNPENATLSCGRKLKNERGEANGFALTRGRDGAYRATCKVKTLREGHVSLDAHVYAGHAHEWRLPVPAPLVPDPRRTTPPAPAPSAPIP